MKFLVALFVSLGLFVSSVSGFTVSGGFSLPASGIANSSYNYIGELSAEGTSNISGRLQWGRSYDGINTASFSIGSGFVSTDLQASVPHNQSSTNPSDGIFTLGIFNGSSISSVLWSIGEEIPTLTEGTYGIRWYVPAKGQGGASSAAGNGSFSITVEPVPEPSTYAFLLSGFALVYAFLRRRK